MRDGTTEKVDTRHVQYMLTCLQVRAVLEQAGDPHAACVGMHTVVALETGTQDHS